MSAATKPLHDCVRAIVREELARLLAAHGAPEEARPISEIDRARARKALARLGVLGPGSRDSTAKARKGVK